MKNLSFTVLKKMDFFRELHKWTETLVSSDTDQYYRWMVINNKHTYIWLHIDLCSH